MTAIDKQQAPKKPVLGKDTLWLVKSSDRILGPFVTGEIIRRLRSKELVVIDEIISPQSRWRHIRDEAIFATVVDEIRTGLMTVRDDTEVDSTGTPTIRSRSTGDDSTPIQQFVASKTSIDAAGSATNAKFDSSITPGRISDAEIVSETDDVEHIHHASAREIERPSEKSRSASGAKDGKKQNVHSSLSYAPPGSARDSSAVISKTSRALWGLVAVAVLIIGASIYFFKVAPVKRAGVRAEEVGRLRTEADRAWSRSEFLRALKLYEQINREPHTDLESDLRQAILQLRVERETLAAKRKLEELIPKLTSSEAKVRARIALAVAHLQSDEPLEAQNALAKLVREPDAGPIAIFNLACAQAATGARSEAAKTLAKLDSHPMLGAPSRLLRALLFLKDGASKQASAAVDLEDQGEQPAWKQELYAVGAASDWLDGNKKRSTQRLRIALETDPWQTEEFFYDPLLFFEAIRWKQIVPYLRDYANHSKLNGAKALYAMALVKADRRIDAQQYLTESLSSRMNDADLQAASAFAMMTQGRDDEARGALKFAKTSRADANGTPTLADVLEARLCERAADRSCAEAAWADVAKRSRPPLAAMVSQARAGIREPSEKSLSAIERLAVLYPHSIQVAKLRDETADAAARPAGDKRPAK